MDNFKNWFQKKYFITEKGKIKDKTKNVYVCAEEAHSKYQDAASEWGRECDVTVEDVKNFIQESTPCTTKDKKEKVPVDVFLRTLFEGDFGKDWYISPTGNEIRYLHNGASSSADFEDLHCKIMVKVYVQQLPYTADEVRRMLKSFLMDRHQDSLNAVMKRIAYDPEVEKKEGVKAFWDYLFYDYFRPEGVSYGVFVKVFRHWMWLVKRKVWNRSVKWHIMLHLFGPTGTGKTETVRMLVKELADFTSETTLSTLMDSTREIKRLTSNYVLFVDELALNGEDAVDTPKLNTAQMDLMKAMLTAEYIDSRVFGTQEQARRKASFTCISAANKHLYDVIFDPTSMRRYVEIPCNIVRPETWDKHNSIMANARWIWKTIDENNDDGYLLEHTPEYEEIEKLQSGYYPTRTTTKMWIDACNVRTGSGTLTDAYDAYRDWCKSSGNPSKALQNFVDDIRHFLPESIGEKDKFGIDFDV